MKNPKDFQEQIIEDIKVFSKGLEKTGIQHRSAEAFAEIVVDYSTWVMNFYLEEDKEGSS